CYISPSRFVALAGVGDAAALAALGVHRGMAPPRVSPGGLPGPSLLRRSSRARVISNGLVPNARRRRGWPSVARGPLRAERLDFGESRTPRKKPQLQNVVPNSLSHENDVQGPSTRSRRG